MRIQDAGVDKEPKEPEMENPQSAKNCETTAASKLSEDCIGGKASEGEVKILRSNERRAKTPNPFFALSIAHRNVDVKSFLQISENFFWQREKQSPKTTNKQGNPKAETKALPLMRMIRNRERAKAKKSQISQFFD